MLWLQRSGAVELAGWSVRCKCCGYRGLVLWGSLGGLRGVSVVVTEVWCCGARWVVCEVYVLWLQRSGAVGLAGWSVRCKCCGYRGLVLWGSLGGL